MNLDDQKFLAALGERLRIARTAAGLTQVQLAAKTGLHRTFIGSVERGERNVSILNLRLLSRRLRVTLNALVDGLS
ncbi:MAG: helix-turn-helix transcriptional regulator [Planctomycetes bacterium]|nr:helix-turn-helix transcriptional regulator [Planctomycetota bacterium]